MTQGRRAPVQREGGVYEYMACTVSAVACAACAGECAAMHMSAAGAPIRRRNESISFRTFSPTQRVPQSAHPLMGD
jgi:hypothetical protein